MKFSSLMLVIFFQLVLHACYKYDDDDDDDVNDDENIDNIEQ